MRGRGTSSGRPFRADRNEMEKKAMCKVIEEVREEAAKESAWKKTVEIVKGMLELNLSHEQIAHAAKITVDQVREIAGEQSA